MGVLWRILVVGVGAWGTISRGCGRVIRFVFVLVVGLVRRGSRMGSVVDDLSYMRKVWVSLGCVGR